VSERGQALLAHFSGHAPEMLADLESLVALESPSDDPSLVSTLAAWVARRLARMGIEAGAVPCPPRGDSVLARVGSGPGGTLLLGHLDTVFPAGTLRERPFVVEGNLARGPGVFDMKGGIAVALAVLEAAVRGIVRPTAPVTLCLTSDEEVGSHACRGLFLEEALGCARVLVLEPSAAGGAAKVARKGVGLVHVSFRGVAAHAGIEPEKGASALLEMARFVLFADALGDAALGTSVVLGTASAGTRTNVVPEEAELAVDFRAWTPAETDRVVSALHAYVPQDPRVVVSCEGGLNRPPMEPTPASTALFEKAARAADALGFQLEGRRVGGGSDGSLTAAVGVPTLDGLGPAGRGAPGRDEALEVPDLPRRAALLSLLLEESA
jgi:glutamate carboxypeptidase